RVNPLVQFGHWFSYVSVMVGAEWQYPHKQRASRRRPHAYSSLRRFIIQVPGMELPPGRMRRTLAMSAPASSVWPVMMFPIPLSDRAALLMYPMDATGPESARYEFPPNRTSPMLKNSAPIPDM